MLGYYDLAKFRCQYFPSKLIRGKDVVLLSEYSLDGDENQRDKTILHEYAHCWLKHTSCVLVEDMTAEEILKQEKEADELVHKWSKKKGLGLEQSSQ